MLAGCNPLLGCTAFTFRVTPAAGPVFECSAGPGRFLQVDGGTGIPPIPVSFSGDERKNKVAVGVVKWWDEKRGFGFISIDGEDDAFVHHSVIQGSGRKFLIEGETVELETEPSPRGWRAVSVRRQTKEEMSA